VKLHNPLSPSPSTQLKIVRHYRQLLIEVNQNPALMALREAGYQIRQQVLSERATEARRLKLQSRYPKLTSSASANAVPNS
jgi:hypothetical protein